MFAKFKYAVSYAWVLRSNNIPANVSLEAIDLRRPYNIPNLPSVYSFTSTGYPGLTNFKYVSNGPLPLE